MAKVIKSTKFKKSQRLVTSNLSLEERLQVIANLVVDRIIEEQRNGTLRMKTRTNK